MPAKPPTATATIGVSNLPSRAVHPSHAPQAAVQSSANVPRKLPDSPGGAGAVRGRRARAGLSRALPGRGGFRDPRALDETDGLPLLSWLRLGPPDA